MVDESEVQKRVTAFWSGVAFGYEDHPGNVPAQDSEEYLEWVKVVADLLPSTPSEVLDLATGTGFVAMIAAGLGHRVTAIDLAEPMLEIARAKAQGKGLSVTFRYGDAVAPEFPEKSFDAVVSRHLFWTLRDPVTALHNWRILLRPGGRMVVIDGFWFKPETEAGDASEQSGLFEQFYSKEIRTTLPGWRQFSVEPLVEMVKGAGFSAVGVKALDAVQRVALHPPSEKPAYAIVGFAADG